MVSRVGIVSHITLLDDQISYNEEIFLKMTLAFLLLGSSHRLLVKCLWIMVVYRHILNTS